MSHTASRLHRAAAAAIACLACLVATATVYADAPAGDAGWGLSADEIHEVVGAHRHDVRACVASGTELPSRLDVVVDILIGSDGLVERATMFESNAGDETVDSCILETIGRLQFPEITNGESFAVRYPFLLVTGN